MAQGTLTADSAARPARRRSPSLVQQAIAVAVLLALVVGFFAYNSLNGQGSARGTAEAFIAALQRGDANRAWALMAVSSTPAGTDASALDRASLAAALSVARPSFPGLTYASAHNELGLNFLDFTYRVGSGTQRLRLDVEREPGRRHLLVLDAFAVHLQAVVVSTTVPSAAGGLTVDGRSLNVPTDRPVKLAVLPLLHRLALAPGGALQAPAVQLNALAGAPEQRVEFKPTLAEGTVARARAAVSEAIQWCASPVHDYIGCRSLALDDPISFTLATAPTLASLEYQQDGLWVARGNFQAIGVYRYGMDTRDRKRVVADAFAAYLNVKRSSITVDRMERIKPFGSLPRPAGADDATARGIVAESLAVCGRARVFAPPDCPQSDISIFSTQSNPVWHLNGDPMAGASVKWDEGFGVLSVSGRQSLTLDYDNTLYGPTTHLSRDYSFNYRAELLWDGAKLVLVDYA